MHFLKRAGLSVWRRKGKSLLLFAIVFILGNVIAGAISIQQGAQSVEKRIKTTLGATATIQIDYDKHIADNPTSEALIDPPSKELIDQIGALPYVKYYDYVLTTYVGSETIKPYVPKLLSEQSDSISSTGMEYYAFNLSGVQFYKVLALEEGTIELVEGRVFTEQEIADGKPVTIISKEVAELNGLKVGDKVSLSGYATVPDSDGAISVKAQIPIELEIIGIFQSKLTQNKTASKQTTPSNEQQDWNRAFQEQAAANMFYVPNGVVVNVTNELLPHYDYGDDVSPETVATYVSTGEPIFVLKSPEDVEKFRQEVTPLLPQYLKIYITTDAYDSIAGPVKKMSELAKLVLIIAIIATITIITLVVLLFLRDRKHELGIYLSFGERKRNVIGQILAEVFMLAFIALSLSVFTGNLTANELSKTLIQQQTTTQDAAYYDDSFLYTPQSLLDPNSVTEEDVIAEYKIQLTPQYILIMYVVGLGTVLLSTVIPTGYIVRLNPKKIMM